ncbi:MAG: hypothetical protein ACTS1Z_09505 [Parasphingopyxis sp.]|uniref:hypothetical protein n=1 Tax=Parasphingopyxis sp. TaxID=1920299 RepID=UPI003FA11024
MKRLLAYGLGLAIGAMTPMAAAMAQEADDREAVARQAPVFDLQPGERRPQPQPDVQGPRAPGMPAPRLLGQEEDRPPPTTARPAPGPTQADPVREPSLGDPRPVAERPAAALPPAAEQTGSVPAQAAPQETADQATTDAVPPAVAESDVVQPVAPTEAAPEFAVTAAEESGLPWWIWLAGMLGVAMLGAAVMAIRKRSARMSGQERALEPAGTAVRVRPADDEGARPATAVPAAKGPPTVLPPAGPPPAMPEPAPAQGDGPSRIEIDFVPLTARLSTLGLTLAYRLVLTNVSDETLTDIAVRLGIRSADDAAMETAPDTGEACVSLDSLEPGKTHTHSAQIRLDPKTYKPVQSDGKAMLVPIVDMMPRYRDADGMVHEMHATMLVGRELEPPRPKMQPFWLERGFGQFRGIGCRMLNVRTT